VVSNSEAYKIYLATKVLSFIANQEKIKNRESNRVCRKNKKYSKEEKYRKNRRDRQIGEEKK